MRPAFTAAILQIDHRASGGISKNMKAWIIADCPDACVNSKNYQKNSLCLSPALDDFLSLVYAFSDAHHLYTFNR